MESQRTMPAVLFVAPGCRSAGIRSCTALGRERGLHIHLAGIIRVSSKVKCLRFTWVALYLDFATGNNRGFFSDLPSCFEMGLDSALSLGGLMKTQHSEYTNSLIRFFQQSQQNVVHPLALVLALAFLSSIPTYKQGIIAQVACC
jgi:hypothetical protein